MSHAEIHRIAVIARTAAILSVVALFGVFAPSPARADSPSTLGPFASWAAIVVAGDWHAHSGAPSEAFDNARRDVTRDLVGLGFTPAHIRQFSARGDRRREAGVSASEPGEIYAGLTEVAGEASGGCLVYFSSHGDSDGVLVGDDILTPRDMARLLDQTCGDRPTVAIISSCYSGVFVPALKSPTRMVLTASRADRSSFGCGETDRYPYFDACFLAEFPTAHDFPDLGHAVQTCVARRGARQTGASPPSQPQLSVGASIAATLRGLTFAHGGRAQTDAPPGVCARGLDDDSNSNSTSLQQPHC